MRPVVIISKTTCPFCADAKQAFQQVGVKEVAAIEIDRLDPAVAAQVQDFMGELTGARTVPRVFIGKKFVGGGTETVNLAQKGELLKLAMEATEKLQKETRGQTSFELQKSDQEWQEQLGPELFRILRRRGTEYPGSHEYDKFHPEKGHFVCAGCELPLYSANSKFRSTCGWPVFNKCYHSNDWGSHVGTQSDGSGSLEIVCPRCGGHLGHVFFDSHTADNANGERH